MGDIIIIPARYGSKRLPGKPLIKIAGKTLLQRVISIAMQAKSIVDHVDVVVATDDKRIAEHCNNLKIESIITDSAINSGSGRALEACKLLSVKPKFIINLQGDAPFITPEYLSQILTTAREQDQEITTPVIQLSWAELDKLRIRKKETPFSGTTCTRSNDGKAYWFSKAIIPAIRNEHTLRETDALSPVYQHLGLYCYRYDILEQYQNSEESSYEVLEGLEQLRLIQMGVTIQTVVVDSGKFLMSGIDSPLDVENAETLIQQYGEPYIQW
ncbi:MAG: 3-deoxy-manno-octulosonate cytidylyltransferase [Gammaproteobacteria bacterium]|nr:3-deoxy-manno-octulosonate cytidylyltransferase [Gammaproteobacteria bacterium]